MIILAIIVSGAFVGWIAQLLLGTDHRGVDWGMALVAGLLGALVGGLALSLLAGDGLGLRPPGLLGAIAGAVAVTAVWQLQRRGGRRVGDGRARISGSSAASSSPDIVPAECVEAVSALPPTAFASLGAGRG